MLIVFEGINGSGKTTAVKKVSDLLTFLGMDHSGEVEPYALGRKITEAKGNPIEQLQLATIDRVRHIYMDSGLYKRIKDEEFIILMDRYYHSTAVYNAPHGQYMDVLRVQREVFPEPDLILWFDVDTETAVKRAKGDDYTHGELEHRASTIYREIMSQLGVADSKDDYLKKVEIFVKKDAFVS